MLMQSCYNDDRSNEDRRNPKEDTAMTVLYKEYAESKMAFTRKHNHDFKVKTSPMDEYEVYHKEYVFADGAVWYERMAPTYRDVEVEVELVKMTVTIKLFETEFWSSDDATSRKYYEKF